MSFLSILGNIGKGLIGMGGPSANKITEGVLNGLGAVGPILSGGAKGSADQRMSEGGLALGYGNLANQQARDQFSSDLAGANAQFGAGMQGAQFGREGQDRAKKNQILMSLLGNMQDAKVTPGNPKIAAAMGSRTGGMRPSALTGNRDALMALLGQPQIEAPQYQAPAAYKPAVMPTMPTAGRGEKILGGLGLGGSILGALGGLFPQGGAQQDSGIPTTVGRVAYAPGTMNGSSGITGFRPPSPQLLLPSRRVAGLG